MFLISILLKILSVCKDYHAFCERLYPLPLYLIKATSYLSYHNMWHLVLQKVQMLVLTCREWDLKCSLCSRIVLPIHVYHFLGKVTVKNITLASLVSAIAAINPRLLINMILSILALMARIEKKSMNHRT